MTTDDILGSGIAVTLHQLVYRIDQLADRRVRERFGVSYSQFHFLAVTTTIERPDVTTLAECLGVTKAAVSKRLDGLVADGLITRAADPGNARRVLIALTPRAVDLVREATELLEGELASALAELPAGEADDLNTRLRVLLDIFIRRAEQP